MPDACIIRTVALLDAIISAWCPEEVYIVPGRNEGRGENEEIPHQNQCQHFFLLPASLCSLTGTISIHKLDPVLEHTSSQRN